jgi:hypothetical protein
MAGDTVFSEVFFILKENAAHARSIVIIAG